MTFMEKQITKKQGWIEAETLQGTFFIDAMYAPQTAIDFCTAIADGLHAPDEIPSTVKCDLLDFTDCTNADDIQEIRYIEGYGARLSAPGYMDCTEWSIFETEAEAEAFLTETYGEE